MRPDPNELQRAGDLSLDPEDGAEPMADPEAPALGVLAPTFAAVYGPDELTADRDRRLVSLARLPGWPGADGEMDAGHGWGAALDKVLGGGICPGYMLAVGAASAGAGKTAWLMQLADGLALRTAGVVRDKRDAPLTPVLLLSEMGVRELTWRTLARWTGHPARVFRAGRSAEDLDGWNRDRVDAAFDDARGALHGAPGEARRYMRALRPGDDAVAAVALALRRWREVLAREADGRTVWPVVVVDPVQRWQAPDADEVQGLNLLAEGLRALADAPGAVVLLTSDTNKPAAANKREAGPEGSREWAAGLFRGSYKLQHAVDAALALWRPRSEDGAGAPGLVGVLAKNRWGGLAGPVGGRYPGAWRWATGDGSLRFTPATGADVEAWTEADRKARTKKTKPKADKAEGNKRAKDEAQTPADLAAQADLTRFA